MTLAATAVVMAACANIAPATTPTPGPTGSPTTASTATAAPTTPATPAATATNTAPSGGPAAELCASDWTTSAATCGGDIGDQFLFQCPPGGRDSGIYGTDTYTDDSFVCVAAVHAGLISIAAGGAVTIQITPGLEAYVASTRNGVESYAWGSWSTSFVFVGGPVAGPTPARTPDMPPGDPLVLAHIPPAFNVNCHEVTTLSAGEVAAVSCTPPQVTGYVTYVLFDTPGNLFDKFSGDLDYFGQEAVDGRDCSAGPCLVAYERDGVVGRYFANNYTGIDPNGLIAYWFDDGLLIEAGMAVYETTFAELYDLALQAGPIE